MNADELIFRVKAESLLPSENPHTPDSIRWWVYEFTYRTGEEPFIRALPDHFHVVPFYDRAMRPEQVASAYNELQEIMLIHFECDDWAWIGTSIVFTHEGDALKFKLLTDEILAS